MAVSIVLVLALAVGGAQSAAVTPIQKVLLMLEDMKAKSLSEKDAETVKFKGFMQFCKDNNAAKGKAISDGSDAIEKLSADIEMYNSDATVLTKEIKHLDRFTDRAKKDLAKSNADYKEDEENYNKLHAEYELNIQDIGVAIAQVKTMMEALNAASAASAASLIQKTATLARFPEPARKALLAFLATSSRTELEAQAPEGATYEAGASDAINDLLNSLQRKFEEELRDLETKWMKTKGAHMVEAQTQTDLIEQHTTMRSHKAATKKEKEQAAAQATADKSDTETQKAEDTALLRDINAECEMKSSDYDSRQKLRAGEVTALNKAIEILSGGTVSGAANAAADRLRGGVAGASAFAQLRRSATTRPSQSMAASFLQAQGRRLSSRTLAALSTRVAADPFGKVKKMIQDMVYKLMEEANQEAEQKGFCDTEMGTNKMTRERKSTDVEELTASIDEMEAKLATLGEEMAKISSEIADTDTAMQESTALRTEERAKNTQTITEAAAAVTAVKQALSVLQTFYQTAGSITPSGTSGGVIAMLEVVLSDFVRLEGSTKSSEDTAQQEYEKFMTDAGQQKAVAETTLKNKGELKSETHIASAAASKDLKSTSAELDAAKAYYEKLKPSCVEEVVSYDDRVARRKEEIESLKESLNILDESGLA